MGKMSEYNKKNILLTIIVFITVCILILVGVVYIIDNSNGGNDRKRAHNLLNAVEKEIANLKKEIPELDRDTFITVDDKVVVGFVEIKRLNMRYPVINVFNKNTFTYSLCRSGSSMPWDIEGMTIYGIDSFTESLEELKDGDILLYEDVTGKKYEYKYTLNIKEDTVNHVIDYGIVICNVNNSGNIKSKYTFRVSNT